MTTEDGLKDPVEELQVIFANSSHWPFHLSDSYYRIQDYRIQRNYTIPADLAVRFKCPHLLSEGSGVRGGGINRYKGMRLKRDAKIEIFKYIY